MGKENASNPAVDAFRYAVSEAITALPPDPPENPYRQQIGISVPLAYGPVRQTGEGKVDFTPPYEQRRVWLPGIEVVLAQHPQQRNGDVVINRFRTDQGHGLIARAWYADSSNSVRRTYTEGSWGISDMPEVSSKVSLDTVLSLAEILRQLQRPDRNNARQALLELAEPLDDVELLRLEEIRAADNERQERFRQSVRDKGGFHHRPLYEGGSPAWLAGVHTLAVPMYDPDTDDPQIRH